MNNTVIIENSNIAETYAKFTETLRAVLGELSFSVMPYGDRDTHVLCRSNGHSLIQFYTYREKNSLRLRCALNLTQRNLQEMAIFEEEFSHVAKSIQQKFGYMGVAVEQVLLQVIALTEQAKSFLQKNSHIRECTVKFKACVLNQVDNVLEYATCLFEGHRELRFRLKNFFENNLNLDIICNIRMTSSSTSTIEFYCIRYEGDGLNGAVIILEISPQPLFGQTKFFDTSVQTFEDIALECLSP